MHRSATFRRKTADALAFLVVGLGALLMIFPLYWMVRSSLMDNIELFRFPPSLLPTQFLVGNYPTAMTSFTFGRYFLNTMLIEVPVLLGVTVTSSLAAYAFSRMTFPLRNFWFAGIIGSMLLPQAVTLIPIFIAYSRLGAIDTYWPMIVPALLGGGGFNIFLLRQFMMTIPKELDESARIDGAGHLTILSSILLPLVKPALIVVNLFAFMNVWNDLLYPVVFLTTKEKFTMTIGLNLFRGSFGYDWSAVMAASTLMVIPALVLYLFGQKYFIEGIVLTGLKS